MRPDKKKRNRGRHTDKSEDTQPQRKSVDSRDTPEKEDSAKNTVEESKCQNQIENKDKAPTGVSISSNDASNDNLPAPCLRRETDALKETKKPSKRQIFNDWKEYDKPIFPEEIEERQFQDFSSLIQQNITEDNYFKFKHERQWENDACNINKDLFNLNLMELSTGLQCIPFYKRLNIPTDLFSKNELRRMDDYAKGQEKMYETNLNSQECSPIFIGLQLKPNKETEIQPEEQIYNEAEVQTFEHIRGGELEIEYEVLTKERQNIVDELSLTQSKEKMVEENQLNVIKNDDKSIVEDGFGSVDNQLQPSEMSTTVTGINIGGTDGEHKVKSEHVEIITESISKPPDEAVADVGVAASDTMDMNTVFESEPLGQRVKPQRSRAKNKPEVVTPGDEEKILESLLSLKEPTIASEDPKEKEMEETENEGDDLTNDLKSIVIHEKKENLEAWLDSMLDD